jgi:small subunit ribosomal protein S10
MSAGQKIRIKIKSFDHKIIDEVAKTIIQSAQDTGAIVAGPIPLPTRIQKFTVLKSTFVNKNARDQYEMRTHKRLIDIKETTPQTIDSLTNLTVPAGVDIEIKMMVGEDAGAKKKTTATKKAKN